MFELINQFITLIFAFAVPLFFAIIAGILAYIKGRSVFLWAFLACLPPGSFSYCFSCPQ